MSDALSRLDKEEDTPSEKQTPQSYDKSAVQVAHQMPTMERDETIEIPKSQKEIAMAFGASKEEQKLEKFPMNPVLIAKEQLRDKALQKSINNNPSAYTKRK